MAKTKIVLEMTEAEFKILQQFAELGYFAAGEKAKKESLEIYTILGVIGARILGKANDRTVITEEA